MRDRAAWLVLLLVAAPGGCASPEEAGKHEAALSRSGPWDIPAETARIGDTQYVSYTGAGPWVGESGCAGGMTGGASLFRDWLRTAFPQIDSIGGYSCRAIVGDSSTTSVHATGRALDVMIPTHMGEADNDLGDPIGNWLIEHAEEIGIQYIIWDRWSWNASRSPGEKERMYGGTHPHHDHLHVELSVQAGNAATPWFDGAMELPDASGCDALPADGGLLEESSGCFRAFGPSAYWRRVGDAGHGGALLWTNAFEGDTPSNWARWEIVLGEGGRYAVEVYAESGYAIHHETRYAIRHAGSDTTVMVDQGAASGWLRIAELDFAAGGSQHLSVYDNTPGPVAAEQHIAADAVRLVRIRAEEPVDPPPMMGTEVDPADLFPDRNLGEVQLIAGGDPALDDDPLRPPGEVSGGCAAGGSGGASGPAALVLLVALLLVIRRRRLRRR